MKIDKQFLYIDKNMLQLLILNYLKTNKAQAETNDSS